MGEESGLKPMSDMESNHPRWCHQAKCLPFIYPYSTNDSLWFCSTVLHIEETIILYNTEVHIILYKESLQYEKMNTKKAVCFPNY